MAQIDREYIERVAQEERQAAQEKVVDVFGNQLGGGVEVLGSCSDDRAVDFMSDIDMWVSFKDEKMPDVLDARHELYQAVGDPLITWEPRRFAPLGGVMSVILYAGPDVVPLEVDMNIAPLSRKSQYEGYIHNGQPSDQFEWEKGEDDDSIGSRLDYTALVTMWATKYWHRDINREEQINWALNRYDRLKGEADITDISGYQSLGGTAVFSAILDSLYGQAEILGDTRRAQAYATIAETVALVEKLNY